MQNLALLQACHRLGGQTRLARLLQTSPSRINKWINNGIRIPYEYAFAIQNLTEGQITCKMLSPYCKELLLFPSTMANRLTLLEGQLKKLEDQLKDFSLLMTTGEK